MEKYAKHEIHSAMNKLMDAHEVMADPEMMKHVKNKMKGMHKIKSIDDLREAHSESQNEDEEELPETENLELESKETHVKNSKYPTIVGKKIK